MTPTTPLTEDERQMLMKLVMQACVEADDPTPWNEILRKISGTDKRILVERMR